MSAVPAGSSAVSPALREKLRCAFEFAKQQVRAVLEHRPGYYPMYTVGGRWGADLERWTHWCDGFFPSMMWIFHADDGDEFWRRHAEAYTDRLAPRRFDRAVHDLGFIFLNTFERRRRLTDSRADREIVIDAGRILAKRFQPAGEYLCSFLGPASLFIDIMMNVPLIFHAAALAGDAGLADLARRHCVTSRRRLVRADGGTAHEAIFDPRSGAFLRESTQQGYRSDSTWTRGLAWALYGFGTVFRQTGEPDFLEAAERCAGCWLRRAEPNLTAPWDFDCPPGPQRIADSSAAAVAAGGLWNLAELTAAPARAAEYRRAALTILEVLAGPEFLARGRPEQEGVLLHGVYHIHKKLGVDESLVFGDHFFVEALDRVLNDRRG